MTHDTYRRRARARTQGGFTLIEMLVSVGLFSVVMVVSVGALLSLTAANKKAQALQSVMNNLNIAVDGMARSARMGTVYHCGIAGAVAPLSAVDCAGGDTAFAFLPYGSSAVDDPVIYSYDAVAKRINRTDQNGVTLPITAPEVEISELRFYVVGGDNSIPGNEYVQPKAVIVIKGNAGNTALKSYTTFHVQATAVQRQLDI